MYNNRNENRNSIFSWKVGILVMYHVFYIHCNTVQYCFITISEDHIKMSN